MRFELRIPPLLLFVVIALAMWLGRGDELSLIHI